MWITSLVAQRVKNLPANVGDAGSIPGSKRSPGEGNGNPLHYSCLGNPMDIGVWQSTPMTSQKLDMIWKLNSSNNFVWIYALFLFSESVVEWLDHMVGVHSRKLSNYFPKFLSHFTFLHQHKRILAPSPRPQNSMWSGFFKLSLSIKIAFVIQCGLNWHFPIVENCWVSFMHISPSSLLKFLSILHFLS